MKPAPAKRAVAIRYRKNHDRAPVIIAKGERKMAERILETAKAHDIALYADKHLADQLIRVELHTEIPLELYEVMAQVLAFVYQIRDDAPKRQDLQAHPPPSEK